jgi:hypothetical protein
MGAPFLSPRLGTAPLAASLLALSRTLLPAIGRLDAPGDDEARWLAEAGLARVPGDGDVRYGRAVTDEHRHQRVLPWPAAAGAGAACALLQARWPAARFAVTQVGVPARADDAADATEACGWVVVGDR